MTNKKTKFENLALRLHVYKFNIRGKDGWKDGNSDDGLITPLHAQDAFEVLFCNRTARSELGYS